MHMNIVTMILGEAIVGQGQILKKSSSCGATLTIGEISFVEMVEDND